MTEIEYHKNLEETIEFFKSHGSISKNGEVIASLSNIPEFKKKSEEQIIFETLRQSKSALIEQNGKPEPKNEFDSQSHLILQRTPADRKSKTMTGFANRFLKKDKKDNIKESSSLTNNSFPEKTEEKSVEREKNSLITKSRLKLTSALNLEEIPNSFQNKVLTKEEAPKHQINEGDYLDKRFERQQLNVPKQDDNKTSTLAKIVQDTFHSSEATTLQTKQNERNVFESQLMQRKKQDEKQRELEELDFKRKEEMQRQENEEQQKIKEAEDKVRNSFENQMKEKERNIMRAKQKTEDRKKEIQMNFEEEESCERQKDFGNLRQITSQNKDSDDLPNLRQPNLSSSQKHNIERRNGSESSVSGTLTIPDRLKIIENLLREILENQKVLDQKLERLENQQNQIIDSQEDQEKAIEQIKNNCIG